MLSYGGISQRWSSQVAILMRPLFCAPLLAAASLFAIAALQTVRGPLSKAELLELVSRGVPGRAVADAVRSYGIAFEPTEEVLKEFRKAGADDVVLKAMRESWRPEPIIPLSDKDILLLLAGDVRSEKIVNMVQQRGIGFDPTEEELAKLRAAGASEALLQAIREAKRVKPAVNQLPNAPASVSSSPAGTGAAGGSREARVTCPAAVSSIPVSASPNDMKTIVAHLECGDRVAILERDSGRAGIDKILVAGGTEGFVQDSYLASSIAPAPRDVTPPVPTYKPEPSYTPQARRDKIQGTVTLLIVIDAQGTVTDARETSNPLGDGLDEKAIERVKTWKFKPATRNGVPVPVRVIVDVSFRLR